MTLLPYHGTPPTRAHPDDAGLDLRAAEAVDLEPGVRMLVGTGTRVALPSGTVGMVCSRSGLAADHGITVLNAPGIVDAGYRGEIKVCLINLGGRRVRLDAGDRVAQLVIVPFLAVEPTPVPSAHHLGFTERGAGGHGSTGR